MAAALYHVIFSLLFLLLFFGGMVALQLFLSRREARWPGLILPLFTFCLSLLPVLSIVDTGSVSQNVLLVIVTLLLGNIPTLILMGIYWACRERINRSAQLKKMNLQDLN